MHLKEILLKEPEIAEHFERVKNVDIALIGIGISGEILSTAVRGGYISEEEVEMQIADGAICDICGIQLNREGDFCAKQYYDRRIGIKYEDLQKIPTLIGVAVGLEKTDAILAALKSKTIHIFATDEATALSILGRI
jgi:lsr operon transcriptional repressor